MLLIICKVVLELKWPRYCVFSAAGNNNVNDNNNANSIIFVIKKPNIICKRQTKIIKIS